MSHVTAGKSVITDMSCVRAIMPKFPKLQLHEDRKKFNMYPGGFLDDWGEDSEHLTARARGVDPSKYGTCDACISMEGCAYEIGITKRDDGEGWMLVWDTYGPGHAISKYIGQDGERFMVEYQKEYCQQYGLNTGCLVEMVPCTEGSEDYTDVILTQLT